MPSPLARTELDPGWGKWLPSSFMVRINNEYLACVGLLLLPVVFNL